MLLLAILLIVWGFFTLIGGFKGLNIIEGILAVVAGICILMGR
jgi:hypothetical protein